MTTDVPTTRRRLDLDDLYRIPFVSDPQISPDGERVAFVVTTADRASDENRSSVWTVAVSGGSAVAFTNGPRDAMPRWAPDTARLAFLAARDGEGKPAQVWVIPVDGGEARRATSHAGGVAAYEWSPDGSRIAFLGIVDLDGEPADDAERTRRARAPRVIRRVDHKADGAGAVGSRRRHLFVADPSGNGDPVQLTAGDWSVSAVAWSPDGTRVAYVADTGEDRDLAPRPTVFVVAADGGVAREVCRGSFSTVRFAPDGSRLLLTGRERAETGHTQLHVVAAEGGHPVRIATGFDRNVMVGAPGYPGARPWFTEDGAHVAFCARDRGCVHVYETPTEPSGVPTKIVGGDDRVVLGASASGRRIAFAAATPASTGEIHVRDGSAERRLTDLVATALDDVEPFVPRSRTFTAPDGTTLHGWVTRGDTTGPGPLLLDVHGGPHNAWGPTFDGSHLYHQVLAADGWTVLTLNPRGSDGYGEDFYRAVSGEWGLSDEADFLAALDALVDDGVADPDRIAVTGYSYGGYMSNWLSARTDRFRAAVTGGCVTNLVSVGGTSDAGVLLARLECGGAVHDAADRLWERSPLAYVSDVTAPTLILHGDADDRCPVGQAEEWFSALRARGVDVELVRYPGASHLFILAGRPSHRVDYCRRIADWVTAHVTARPRAAALEGR